MYIVTFGTPTLINEIKENKCSLFPDLSSNLMYINLNQENSNAKIGIISLQEKNIDLPVEKINGTQYQLSISNLSTGIYFLSIEIYGIKSINSFIKKVTNLYFFFNPNI